MNNKQPKKENKNADNKPSPKWFYAVMLSIPVIFFLIVEIILRISGYGLDYTLFKPISGYYPDKIFLNPDIPYKYFYNIQKAPSPLPDGFDKAKKENAFRVFILGGSSAAGWPYVPNASFSRHIKRRLELLYPENTIEVINLGISAINSYTVRDFVPQIIEQKPDLILIYMGHNEYYGALGVGSTVSFGSSRFLINTYLWLKQFKTTELVQYLISGIYGLFSPSTNEKGNEKNETLMSRMIGESAIPLNSTLYTAGIEQFEGNLYDILEMFNDENIPVLAGTLTSNTLDQKPFVSEKFDDLPPADSIYNLARKKLKEGLIAEADSLFNYAKDLDALRFRAPTEMNNIIREAANKFNIALVEIDSIFKKNSPNKIVGYNLTVDHLHPNLRGYKIIGKAFYEQMEIQSLLPSGKRKNITIAEQDSILEENFPFTVIDSTLAEMQIIRLTGGFPFVPKGTPNYKMQNFKINSFADSLCLKVIREDIKWETAHSQLADRYYLQGNINGFIRELNAIIEERPFFDQPYEYLTQKLVEKGMLDLAEPYFYKLHKIKPEYFTYKWLGQINLYKKNYETALDYLLKAVEYPESDYQTWYNIAGAYYYNNQIENAKLAIEKSLKLNPKNPLAQNFYTQLKSLQ